MSGFGMIVEDPFYDEDGVLIDEDVELDECEEVPTEFEYFNPFNTVNS